MGLARIAEGTGLARIAYGSVGKLVSATDVL